MMILRKALLPVAVLLLCAPGLPAANTVLVYGPAVFTVHRGSPTPETVSFPLPSLLYGPFTLLVDHKGVTGMNVELNGTPIFGSPAFGPKPLRAVVHLQTDNSLQVELTGTEGGSVTLMITGNEYEHAAEYAALPLAAAVSPAITFDNTVDWRAKGAVTPVKNEGQCGSSWAFSATGAMEGLGFISGKGLISLSEQQLVDCSGSAGNHGCNGGTAEMACEWYKDRQPTATEDYPYTGRDGSCKQAPGVLPKVVNVVRIPPGDEASLLARLGRQPVSAVLRIGAWFNQYTEGIANPACEEDTASWDVLIIGYGKDKNTLEQYWIIKNSQGTTWGSGGYLYLKRDGLKNKCGIADYAIAPEY